MSHPLWSLLIFAVVVVVSPGANNLMATSSGLHFGVLASLRLLAGLAAGVVSLVVVAALGLGSVVTALPQTEAALRAAGTAYLLWLALRIVRTAAPDPARTLTTPQGFTAGLLTSVLNPKVWVLAISAGASFSAISTDPVVLAAVLGGVFAVVVAPNLVLWCCSGQVVAGLLTTPLRWRVTNAVLAVLLLASIPPMWID